MNAVTQEQQTALSLPERAAVALGAAEHEIRLRELVKSSADIVAVIDMPGRDQAHRIGMNLKGARVAIEKVGKAAREDATAFSKAVIAEEKRLIGIAAPEEERILGLRDTFDAAEQARKDALIAAERARVEAIQADIERLRAITPRLVGKSADDLAFALKDMQSMKVEESRFFEFTDSAVKVVADVVAAIESMHAAAVEREAAAHAAEQARIAEAARLEAERKELAELRAAAERTANEQAATAKRLADQEAAQALAAKQLADKAAANLKAERDAQAERMRIERQSAADAQAKASAEIKAAQDALNAKIAAHDAAVRLEADHAAALIDNAEFDAEREADQREQDHLDSLAQDDAAADLARCTVTAQAMLTNGRSLMAESIDAYVGGGLADEADEPAIDYEAIAWAYKKLLAYGVGNTGMDNAMMLDRLNLMLLTAEVTA